MAERYPALCYGAIRGRRRPILTGPRIELREEHPVHGQEVLITNGLTAGEVVHRLGLVTGEQLVLDPLDDPRVSLVKDVAQIAAGIEVLKRVEH